MTREKLTLMQIEHYVKKYYEDIEELSKDVGDDIWSNDGVCKQLGIARSHIEFINIILKTYNEIMEEESLKEEEWYRERGIIE